MIRKMKIVKLISIVVFASLATYTPAQGKTSDYLNKRWKEVANRMPSEWYGTNEAKLVAENVLLCQKDLGGWEKNKPFHHILSESEKLEYRNAKSKVGGTFDNDATITELKFLAKVYAHIHDERYKQAFENGLNYIFIAQYKNGGWPQYFPVKNSADEMLLDKTRPYSMHITYNDDAMVNTMQFLKDIFSDDKAYTAFQLNNDVKVKAKNAFDKGVECILKTQIIVDGKPTVWCAQHDEITLAPANARAYELASFSGSESVGIILLLMDIENPSKEIVNAVNGAVTWLENHKIDGIKLKTFRNKDGERDRVVVEDKAAPTLWARFYDLETEKPYFCDRDGIERKTLAELGYERRNGYGWYTDRPEEALRKYSEWEKNVAKN